MTRHPDEDAAASPDPSRVTTAIHHEDLARDRDRSGPQ